ncbi:MAG: glycosyltransferase [bacterium]|nr:glycosyltransferase [bacterium]
MKTIDIVMTAADEEALQHVLASIPVKELEEQGYAVSIIISHGIHAGRIAEIASNASATAYSSSAGYGQRYRHIFSKSQADIIVALDADGSYSATQIPALIKALEDEGLDFISVNRMWNQEKGAMSLVCKFGNYFLDMIAAYLFDIYIVDSQSRMWAFRRSIFNELKLHANGLAFSEEIKIEAISNFICREIPGIYKKRIGKVKISSFYDGLTNLAFLFRKRLINI